MNSAVQLQCTLSGLDPASDAALHLGIQARLSLSITEPSAQIGEETLAPLPLCASASGSRRVLLYLRNAFFHSRDRSCRCCFCITSDASGSTTGNGCRNLGVLTGTPSSNWRVPSMPAAVR